MPVIKTTTVENFLTCPRCKTLMQKRCQKCGLQVQVFGSDLQKLPEYLVDRVQATVNKNVLRVQNCMWCGEPTDAVFMRVLLMKNGADEAFFPSQGRELCEQCNTWSQKFQESFGRAIMSHGIVRDRLLELLQKTEHDIMDQHCARCPYGRDESVGDPDGDMDDDDYDDGYDDGYDPCCYDCRWNTNVLHPVLRDLYEAVDKRKARMEEIEQRYEAVKTRHIAACNRHKAELGR